MQTTMDQTKVAIGAGGQIPSVLVDLQAFFELNFEMDERLAALELVQSQDVRDGDQLFDLRDLSKTRNIPRLT